MSDAREGKHGASEQWQLVNRTPCAAIASIVGEVFLW
jgi:hypothetical protein